MDLLFRRLSPWFMISLHEYGSDGLCDEDRRRPSHGPFYRLETRAGVPDGAQDGSGSRGSGRRPVALSRNLPLGSAELEPSTLVSCGATATEIIFLAENDCREIGRIPRGSILGVFGGEESDTHAHLAALGGLPSLILAQSENRRKERKEGTSYTVIDWSDGPSRRRQIVFKSRGKTAGRWCAVALDVMRESRRGFKGNQIIREIHLASADQDAGPTEEQEAVPRAPAGTLSDQRSADSYPVQLSE